MNTKTVRTDVRCEVSNLGSHAYEAKLYPPVHENQSDRCLSKVSFSYMAEGKEYKYQNSQN
jgi:hypothetical protein